MQPSINDELTSIADSIGDKRKARDSHQNRPKQKRTKPNQGGENVNTGQDVDSSFAELNPQLLADYLLRQSTRFAGTASSIETQDKTIPGMICLP